MWPIDAVRGVLEVARRHGLRAHLDGARVMNAVVASGTSAAEYASGFDTAWIDLAKGLGAPVGAVLAGSRELIDEAWRHKQMLGGALRQSGHARRRVPHALDHHVKDFAADHEHARLVADNLAKLPAVRVDPDAVDTNIVIFEVDAAGEVAQSCSRREFRSRRWAGRLRAVTHRDVDRREIYRALAAFRQVLGSAGPGAARRPVASLSRRAEDLLRVQEGPGVREQPKPLDGRHQAALQPEPAEGPHRREGAPSREYVCTRCLKAGKVTKAA